MGEVIQTMSCSAQPPTARGLILCAVFVPMTFAFQDPGTGGERTREYYDYRRVDDMPAYYRPSKAEPANDVVAPSAAKFITTIQRAFKLPISDLSVYLGVSRPTIYAWARGGNISPENIANLERFARAADVISAAGVEMNPIMKDRKLPGGKTLFESISAGIDGEAAALSFVTMLDAEARRRNELLARFKGRPKRGADSDDDAPSAASA